MLYDYLFVIFNFIQNSNNKIISQQNRSIDSMKTSNQNMYFQTSSSQKSYNLYQSQSFLSGRSGTNLNILQNYHGVSTKQELSAIPSQYYFINESQNLLKSNQTFKQQIKSIQRQFQLKIQKQKQYCDLIKNKISLELDILKQQNQNLKLKNKQLVQKVNKYEQQKQQTSSQEIKSQSKHYIKNQIDYYKKMFNDLQTEHQHCIKNKKQLLENKQSLQFKINLLQRQNQQFSRQIKQYKNKLILFDQIQSKNKQYQHQILNFKKQIQQKQIKFFSQIAELQKAVQQTKRSHQNSLQINESSNTSPKQSKSTSNGKNFHQSYTQLLNQRKKNLSIFQQPLYTFQKNITIDPPLLSLTQRDYVNSNKALREKQIIQRLYNKNLDVLHQPLGILNRKRVQGKSTKQVQHKKLKIVNNVENIAPEQTISQAIRQRSSSILNKNSQKYINRQTLIHNNHFKYNSSSVQRYRYL